MRKSIKKCGGAVLLGLISSAGWTQVTANDVTKPNDVADALPDVVVTARKVAERLQDVPVSVTAISGVQLQEQSAVKMSDIALLTPGLLMNEGLTPGQTVFNIRGQAQTSVNASTDPSVGVYVDGLYWARAIGADANLLDLQNAQVLRGPQGTLFGRNTVGGAILLQSNDPNFEGTSGSVSAKYGTFEDRGVTAIVNLPVNEQIATRFAFTGERRDGYINDTFNAQELNDINTYTGRGKVLFKATDRLTLLFAAEIYETNTFSNPYRTIYVSPSSLANLDVGIDQYGPPGAGGLAQRAAQGAALLSSYVAGAAQSDTISTNVVQSTFARTQTYSGTANLDTDFGAIKLITGYRGLESSGNTDLDGSPYDILFSPYIQNVHQVSAELQATGDAFEHRLKFASGLFYFHENGRDDTPLVALPALNPDNPTIYDGNVTTDSRGVYTQETWHITDPLSFTGGLRYSFERRGVTVFNRSFDATTGTYPCLLSIAIAPECNASRADTFSNVSYSAGFEYKLSEDDLVYVKADRGFRAGGENLKSAGDIVAFQPFKPEIIYSYEFGVKTESFERRLRFDADYFYSLTHNMQQQTVVSSPDGVASNVIGNAGEARIQGVEIEAAARITPSWLVGFTATYTDAMYVNYIDPNTGANLSNYFFDAPKYTFSNSVTYTHDLPIGGLLLRADYAWTDRRHLAPYNTPSDPDNAAEVAATTVASVGLLNLRAALNVLADRLELAAYCRNATDNRGKVVVEQLPSPLSVIIAERRDPRTVGLSATYKFGGT